MAADDRLDIGGRWKISFSDESDFKNSDLSDAGWQSIEIPGSWHNLKDHKGIAWLRTTFQIPDGFRRANTALAFVAQDADEAYLNGVLIGRSASIEDKDSHAYERQRIYYIPPELLRSEGNVLALRIRSDFGGRRGIPAGTVALGDLHSLEKERALKEVVQMCFGAVYLTAGLYFLLFFLRLPKIRPHLYFSIFCLLLSAYILLRVALVSDLFGFLTAKRIEYMVLFILPVPFLAFWASLFNYRQAWYVLAYYGLLASFLYFPISSNRIEIWNAMLGRWYYVFAPGAAAVLLTLFRELRRGSPLARILAGGILVFFIAIVNDMLIDRGIISTVRLLQYGFLGFVVTMAASLVQSFVRLQRQSEETLQRLMEMDQLKERLLSNTTEVLLSPAALILSVARRLRGHSHVRNTADYEELQRHGAAMSQALDGVLLLSRIQSGVESASFRSIGAADLARLYPRFAWPAEVRIFGTESLLRLLLEAGPPGSLEISWQNETGLTIALPPRENESLQDNVIREAVKALQGESHIRSNKSWLIQIPPAPADAVWTGALENISRLRGTVITRMVFSLAMLAVLWFLDQRALAAAQAAHLLFALGSLAVLWRAAKPGLRRPRAGAGAVHAYLRSFIDLGQIGIAVYATGGLDSPWLMGFAIPAVFSSFGKDPWRGRFAAAAGTVFALLSEAGSASGFLPDVNIFGKGATPTAPLQMALHTALIAAGLAALAEITNRLYRSAVQAREESQTERERAQKMNDFIRAMNATTDFSRIIEQIVSYLQTSFRIDSLILLLPDAQSGDLIAARAFTTASVDPFIVSAAQALRVPAGPEGGIVRATFERKKPLYVKVRGPRDIFRREYPGIARDRDFVELLRFEWFLLVPLVVQDRAVGLVLCTSYRKQDGLTRTQISEVESLCDQVAGAVNSTEMLRRSARERDHSEALRKEAEAAREEMRKLAEFSKTINESADIKGILDGVFTYLRAAFGAEDIVLQLADETKKELHTVQWSTDRILEASQLEFVKNLRVPLNKEGGSLFRTFEKQRPFYLSPGKVSRFSYALDRTIIETLRVVSVAQFPLVIQNRTIGILWLSFGKERRSSKEIESMARFCDQIAGAVYTAQLLADAELARIQAEAANNAAQQARDDLERMADFTRRMNETSNLDAIASGVFTYLHERFGLEHCAILLVDEEAGEIRSGAVEPAGPARTFWKNFRAPLEASSGTLYKTYVRRKPLYLRRISEAGLGPLDLEIIRVNDLKAFIQVPLVVQEKTAGIVVANATRFLRAVEIHAVARLCDQIAGAVQHARLLQASSKAREESDRLLANILPAPIAEELKRNGQVEPLFYDSVSVLFTDFVGFTRASEGMLPDELVAELDGCFSQFDAVAKRNNMEKLKTIGDSYMCAGGLPRITDTHAVDACLTALEFRSFMITTEQIKKSLGLEYWQIRIGLHTGPVTAGVIGTNKFAYDIWGDTVNTASRMESSGSPGMVNISGDTYALVKDFFECEYRGKVSAKGKGEVDMYFLQRIRPELSADADGLLPNAKFEMMRMGIGG